MKLPLSFAILAGLLATALGGGAGILNPSTPGSGLDSSLFGERFIGLGPPYFGQQPTTLVIKLAQDYQTTFPSSMDATALAQKKTDFLTDLVNIVAGYMEINTARIKLDTTKPQPYMDQYDPRTTVTLSVDFPFPGWGALVWTRTFTDSAQWLRGLQAEQDQFAAFWNIGYSQCTGPFSIYDAGVLCSFVTIKTPAAPPPPPPPVLTAVNILFTAYFDIDLSFLLSEYKTQLVHDAIVAGFTRAFSGIEEIKRVDVDNLMAGVPPASRRLLQQEYLLADIKLVVNLQSLYDQGMTQEQALSHVMSRVIEILTRLVNDPQFALDMFVELAALGGRFKGFFNLRFGPFTDDNDFAPPPKNRPDMPNSPPSPEPSPDSPEPSPPSPIESIPPSPVSDFAPVTESGVDILDQ